MQVAVDPRALLGQGQRAEDFEVPPRGRPVDQILQLVDAVVHGRRPISERTAAIRVHRCVRRRGRVQRGEERAELLGRRERVGGRGARCDLTGQPRRHAPRPGIAESGSTRPDRYGDRKREPWRQVGQPPLLMHDELGAHLSARESDHERVAEPEQDVVPSRRVLDELEVGEVAMLRFEQSANELRVDLDLGRGHVPERHERRR